MFSGEQLLHKIVPALIRAARGAGEMIIDSHPGRATEIICDGKNFIGWFPLTEQPLRVRTCRADRLFGFNCKKQSKKQTRVTTVPRTRLRIYLISLAETLIEISGQLEWLGIPGAQASLGRIEPAQVVVAIRRKRAHGIGP